jgi:hypothetical protein
MNSFIPAGKLPSELLKNCRVLPSRYDLLSYLPKQKVIAEIGVAFGDFSENLIRYCEPSLFLAIDTFILHTLVELWGKSPRETFGDLTHLQFFQNRFSALIEQQALRVLEGDSSSRIEMLDDHSVDIFYVDGDHSYDGVWRDLTAITKKIRRGGLIIMNDYIMRDQYHPYGVVQATNEFMTRENWEMLYFCLEPNMFCDVVLAQAAEGLAEPDRMARLEAETLFLRQSLESMRHSTSWKLTAPVRGLKRLFGQPKS